MVNTFFAVVIAIAIIIMYFIGIGGNYLKEFYFLFIFGLLICFISPRKFNSDLSDFGRPLNILILLLGFVIVAWFILSLLKLKFNFGIPFISSYRESFLVMSALILILSILSALNHTLLKKF